MATVQPSSLHSCNEELRAISVGTSIGHAEHSWTSVLQLEMFIRKLVTINALPSCSISTGEVTSLYHKIWDYTMKVAALEMKVFATLSHTLVSFAQMHEVCCCFWHVLSVQADDNPACRFTSNLHIKETLVCHCWIGQGG